MADPLDSGVPALGAEQCRAARAMLGWKVDDLAGDSVVTAGTAVQRSPEIPIVEMQQLVAKMSMRDGPADIVAPRGAYNFDNDTMAVDGPVNFKACDG